MDDDDLIFTPFTDEQVEALAAYQQLKYAPAYRCKTNHPEGRNLIPKNDGWHCPHAGCTYTQHWAHKFTADKTKHPPRPVFGNAKE